ncbi:MAG: hypothetical protein IPO93_14750 [Actinobacteria bacterium]|nr:hypothetical protein [Actinomycetota bacterium]
MSSEYGASRQEVILVTHPARSGPPNPLTALRDVFSNSVGMATYTASTLASLVEQTITYTVTTSVNQALDRLVPVIADAIVERLDLTDLVLQQVDLNRIVTQALDGLDLTQLVIDRVDIDAIVAEADIDAVIDRVPVIPLAHYVIDEIDLPAIIRQSTGGVASDAVNAVRIQGVGADQLVARLADKVVFRRRQRKVDAPGEPESLLGRMQSDLDSTERLGGEPVDDAEGGPA